VQCRNCGTDIADKALICYRCGTATTEAKFKPAAPPRRTSPLMTATSVLALVLLVIVALYMGRTPAGETPHYVSWLAIGVAVVLVIMRAFLRRRK
jgi:hypothetical protein